MQPLKLSASLIFSYLTTYSRLIVVCDLQMAAALAAEAGVEEGALQNRGGIARLSVPRSWQLWRGSSNGLTTRMRLSEKN